MHTHYIQEVSTYFMYKNRNQQLFSTINF